VWCGGRRRGEGPRRYPEDRLPHVQALSQDNVFRLPTKGSSDTVMCPRSFGSRSRLRTAPGPSRATAGDSTGAATCHLGSITHLMAQDSFEAATCHLGSAGCKQINKYPMADQPS
jgi:hypothetical protein